MYNVLSPEAVTSRTDSNVGPAVLAVRGFTLVELLVVVSILALLAVVATPYLRVPSNAPLARATASVMSATIYARDAAIASGQIHALVVEAPNVHHPTNYVFAVSRLVGNTLQIVQHPITRAPYVFSIAAMNAPGAAWVEDVQVTFDDTCSAATTGALAFDAHGTPRCPDPLTSVLTNASVTLSLADVSQTVAVSEYTGRVTKL